MQTWGPGRPAALTVSEDGPTHPRLQVTQARLSPGAESKPPFLTLVSELDASKEDTRGYMDVSKSEGVRKTGQSQWSDLPPRCPPTHLGSIPKQLRCCHQFRVKVRAAIMMLAIAKVKLQRMLRDTFIFCCFKVKCGPLLEYWYL